MELKLIVANGLGHPNSGVLLARPTPSKVSHNWAAEICSAEPAQLAEKSELKLIVANGLGHPNSGVLPARPTRFEKEPNIKLLRWVSGPFCPSHSGHSIEPYHPDNYTLLIRSCHFHWRLLTQPLATIFQVRRMQLSR